MIGGFVALAALIVGLFRDVKGDVRETGAENREAHAQIGQRLEDSRAETREAHAQTGKRIDDLRAIMLAIVPRAAAETADA